MKSISESDHLNYHHLRYFWAVAREGGLGAAAKRLHVSQSSICTQVQQLEATLGDKLFRQSGRGLALTEYGQVIFGYAEEIFSIGQELVSASARDIGQRGLRLAVAVVDAFPKLMTLEILRPLLKQVPAVQITCTEGKLADLLGSLTAHRVDLVLADEPASPSEHGKVFNHLLGTSDIVFCAMPSLGRSMKGKFPGNLNGAPALLPTHNAHLRRDLEQWFTRVGVKPRLAGEFEDGALAKIVASEGHGFIALPQAILPEAVERYGFVCVGRTKHIQTSFYAISAERRIHHPAVLAITGRAQVPLPGGSLKKGSH